MNEASMRWRVKDWTSCFYACRLSDLDEEAEQGNCSPSRRGAKEDKVAQRGSSPTNGNIGRSEDKEDHRGSPRVADEDYIVFRFRDDGVMVHVVEDCCSEATTSGRCSGNKCNKQILRVEKIVRQVNSSSCREEIAGEGEVNSNPERLEQVMKTLSDNTDKGEEGEKEGGNNKKKNKNSNSNSSSNSIDTRKKSDHYDEIQIEETKECIMVSSVESSESNKSDASTRSSFTFPGLHWEWTGSPVQMPKAKDDDDFHFKRRRSNKLRNLRLRHCWKF